MVPMVGLYFYIVTYMIYFYICIIATHVLEKETKRKSQERGQRMGWKRKGMQHQQSPHPIYFYICIKPHI